MPYIIPSRKKQILSNDPNVNQPQDAGELTFEVQQCVARYIEAHGLKYQRIAECLGALEGAKVDFTERVIDPYERSKIFDNGDVWPAHIAPPVTQPTGRPD